MWEQINFKAELQNERDLIYFLYFFLQFKLKFKSAMKLFHLINYLSGWLLLCNVLSHCSGYCVLCFVLGGSARDSIRIKAASQLNEILNKKYNIIQNRPQVKL
jgi:hypothetical protein